MESDSDNTTGLLDFPCAFPIKVMGKTGDAIEELVLSILRKHVADIQEGGLKSRISRQGNYLAVTVTIEAKNQAQIDAIYLDLTANRSVIMAL